MTHRLADWAVAIMDALGYFGVFFLVALENLIPPIPSELILPLAGFSVGLGRLTLLGVMGAATLGSIVGALLLYAIGYFIGERRLRALMRRMEATPILSIFVNEGDLDKAQGMFVRYGSAMVLFGRLVPVVRSLISIPAGFQRMPLLPFILYTTLGSGVWNGLLVGAGYLLGEQWGTVRSYTKYFEYGVILLLGVAVLAFLFRRLMARRTATAQGAGEGL